MSGSRRNRGGGRSAGAAQPYANEIVIHPDGTVAFKHLDRALLELAAALAPEDERVRRRLALATRGTPEGDGDRGGRTT